MKEQSDQSGGEDEREDIGVEPLEVGPLLDEDDGSSYLLPKHHRCACHLMNLVATVDLKSANDNPGYKKLSCSSFAKCQSLWNKSSRSPAVSEIIEEHCKLQLLRPCETRFTPVEIEFLCEYVKTMSPVAKAVDVLQGESKVQMGWLVPTITLLKSKLKSLHATSKHCGPLVVALQAALERRFREMLVDPELIAAAILVPKFRTHWTTDESILKRSLDYIKTHLEEQTGATQSDGHVSSEEEGDFFSSIKRNDQRDSNTKQLESYLLSQTDTMDILKTVPSVCRLSVKLNTPLPASAACERLFSTAGNIFTPRRARLGSKLFENLILMRLNRKFC
ncbi:uncharacterized protein LOC141793906 [Halichoeres trimaculatus]|uniref:uncharacterized protein LOC141793906 n=1 Tax=Halichoeres trimaculatus TaxID=147232 RepID=UPI003D9E475C